MSQTIEFYWDVGSPYTYLASTQIEALAERTGSELVWKPFLLGGVFKLTGNRPPIEVSNKGPYMWQNLQLWAGYYDVPITFPSAFPINSLVPMRAAVVAAEQGKGAAFAKAVMHRFWGEGVDVSGPEAVADVADRIGLDGAAVVESTGAQEVKDKLKQRTGEAVERGAFGAPWMIAGDQAFWGNDHLPLLEAYLNGETAA